LEWRLAAALRTVATLLNFEGEPSLARSRAQPASTTRKASRSKGGGKPPHSKRVRGKEFGLARFAGVSPGYQTMWVGRREKAIQEPGALEGRDFSPAVKALATVGLKAPEVGW
jgi:hypothetical protein